MSNLITPTFRSAQVYSYNVDVVRDGCKCSQGFALVGLKVPPHKHGLKMDSVEGKVMVECYRSPTYNMQKHVNDILHFLEKNLGQALCFCVPIVKFVLCIFLK